MGGALALAITLSPVTAGIANAAPPTYQAHNVADSDGTIKLYGWRGCTDGPTYNLHPGWVAKSEGWDAFLAVGDFEKTTYTLVKIYSKKTGKRLAVRKVPDGVCYNMSNNAHKIERR